MNTCDKQNLYIRHKVLLNCLISLHDRNIAWGTATVLSPLGFVLFYSVPTLPLHLTGSQRVLGFDAEAWTGKKEKQQ